MLAVASIQWDNLELFRTSKREHEYRGWMNESVQVILKKFWSNTKYNAEKNTLSKLKHENVIRLFSPVQNGELRYLALEFCETSLQEICDESYRSKISLPFKEANVLYQIANGLQYIHNQGIVHADVTPENILLTTDYQAKISGFEFSRETDSDGTYALDTNNLGHNSYLAPEILRALQFLENSFSMSSREKLPKLSTKVDVFSAGCSFFFLVTTGIHPFGATKYTIPYNISQKKQINARKLPPQHFSWAMIQSMIRSHPNERPSFDAVKAFLENVLSNQDSTEKNWTGLWYTSNEVLRMTCDIFKKLGSTDKKSVGQVFAGTLDGANIAVKRILLSDLPNRNPVVPFDVLKQINHENVLRFFHETRDEDFTYLGYELCAANLSDYYRDLYDGPVPSVQEGLQQMAKGLLYIHSKNLMHGSIRPTNVLISFTTPVHLKLSDFGIRHPDMVTTAKSSGYGKYSKEFYHPPELLRNLKNAQALTNSRDELWDMFSLGCVFYTYATKGDHPFHEKGTPIYFINPNIINGRKIIKGLNDDPAKKDIILKMIEDKRDKRMTLNELEKRLLIN